MVTCGHTLRQLQLDLPREIDDVEQRARAVLRHLFDRIVRPGRKLAERTFDEPTGCPNCGARTASTRSPYCGERCREVAGFVRQVRAGLADGSILDEQRQVAFGQVLWHLLGGGRPLRVQQIPEAARLQVLSRAAGKCSLCGARAVTVDHIATGCNRTINLRAVCNDCNRTRPFGDAAVLDRAESAEMLEELATRIGSPASVRDCDDSGTWDWRVFLERRKASTSHR